MLINYTVTLSYLSLKNVFKHINYLALSLDKSFIVINLKAYIVSLSSLLPLYCILNIRL